MLCEISTGSYFWLSHVQCTSYNVHVHQLTLFSQEMGTTCGNWINLLVCLQDAWIGICLFFYISCMGWNQQSLKLGVISQIRMVYLQILAAPLFPVVAYSVPWLLMRCVCVSVCVRGRGVHIMHDNKHIISDSLSLSLSLSLPLHYVYMHFPLPPSPSLFVSPSLSLSLSLFFSHTHKSIAYSHMWYPQSTHNLREVFSPIHLRITTENKFMNSLAVAEKQSHHRHSQYSSPS